MRIEPSNTLPPCGRSGRLKNITAQQISETLGFEPNIQTVYWDEWSFTSNGHHCGVWPYGLQGAGVFSTSGDAETLTSIFPENVAPVDYLPVNLTP